MKVNIHPQHRVNDNSSRSSSSDNLNNCENQKTHHTRLSSSLEKMFVTVIAVVISGWCCRAADAVDLNRTEGVPRHRGCPPRSSCECRQLEGGKLVAKCRVFPVVFSEEPSTDGVDNGGEQYETEDDVLASLSLARIGLTRITGTDDFKRLRTRALDLSGNELTGRSGCCTTEAFSGLGDVLQTLAIADSGLAKVPSTALRSLVELTTLNLDGNKVVT